VITNRHCLWHAGPNDGDVLVATSVDGGSADATSIGHSGTNEQPKPREEIKQVEEELEFWKVLPDLGTIKRTLP
jgi:hypothetical protein